MADYNTTPTSTAPNAVASISGFDTSPSALSTDHSGDDAALLDGPTATPLPKSGVAPSGAAASIGANGFLMHSRLQLDDEHTCAVEGCLRVFENGSKLQQHASKTGHRAFQCRCDKAYTKLCSLTRHIKEAVEKPRHRCPICTSRIEPWLHTFVRISHLEAHLRRVHRTNSGEVEALFRHLRKNKSSKLSSKSASSADDARTVTTTASGDNAGTFLSAPAAVSKPVGGDRLNGTNPTGILSSTVIANPPEVTGTTTGTSFGDQAGQQFVQSGSVDAIRTTGLSLLSAGAHPMSVASCLNPAGRVDPIAAEAVAGPTGVPTAVQNMFDYGSTAFVANDPNAFAAATAGGIPSNTAIQPTPFSGYNQTYFDNFNAQQGGFSALPASVHFGHQLQHPTAPGGAFVGLPQACPLGHGQTTTHGDYIGQRGMSFGPAATAAGYPSHQAACLPVPGGAFAASQSYQSAGFGNYGQFGHGAGAGGVQQNAFYGLEAGYLMPNPTGLRPIAPNNFHFDMGTAGCAHVGAGFSGLIMAPGASNTANGEDISGLTNGDNMDDFGGFDGTNFGNGYYNAGW